MLRPGDPPPVWHNSHLTVGADPFADPTYNELTFSVGRWDRMATALSFKEVRELNAALSRWIEEHDGRS